MKKNLQFLTFLLATIMASSTVAVYGQTPCSVGLHRAFGEASSEKPVVLKRLGTSPQFGEIPKHTAKSAFSHLAMVHSKNIRNSKTEIDAFLIALGYTGFKDPSFGVSKISPEILPAGKIGWMGAYAKGHQYKWSVLGKDFETFRVQSKDGSCYAYIMKKCGNAFYDPAPRDAAALAFAAANAKPKFICPVQTITFSGKSSIQAGDVLKATKTLPIVATYNGKSVCLGEYTVPVRLAYEVTASGDVNYSKTVEVCDYGNGVPANLNLSLPLQMKYSLGATDYTIGEDGKMQLGVSQKQFAALSKVYGACASNVANAPSNSTLAALNKNEASTTSAPAKRVAGGENGSCVKQTLNLSGNSSIEQVSNKVGTQEVTLIGMYRKTGKLQKGETAEKYMCLGSYTIPANTSLQYAVNTTTSLQHFIEVCDKGGVVNPVENIAVTPNVKHSVSKQDLTIGDYGKVYTTLTQKQYKKLGKIFKRCCSDGTTSAKCY
jgi:hypothetical protein